MTSPSSVFNDLSPKAQAFLDKLGLQNSSVDPTVELLNHVIECVSVLSLVVGCSNSRKSDHNQLESIGSKISRILKQEFKSVVNFLFTNNWSKYNGSSATMAGYIGFGQQILTFFPDIASSKEDYKGRTILHESCLKANSQTSLHLIQVLLSTDHGVTGMADSDGSLPLHCASRNPFVNVITIQKLIAAYPESCRVKDKKGQLPLHIAVRQVDPNIDVIKLLVENYREAVEEPCNTGELPFHLVCDSNNVSLELVVFLLSLYPAAIEIVDHDGYLPLHKLVDRPDPDVEALQYIINEYPQGVEKVTFDGQLALHRTIDHHMSSAEVARILMEAYPNSIKIQDKDGCLPLHLALDTDVPNMKVVGMLLRKYPEAVKIASRENLLPLHLVISQNLQPSEELVKVLLQLNPAGLEHVAMEKYPADELADVGTWEGPWITTKWTPLSRAIDRKLTNILAVFKKAKSTTAGSTSLSGGTGTGLRGTITGPGSGGGVRLTAATSVRKGGLGGLNEASERTATLRNRHSAGPGDGVSDGMRSGGATAGRTESRSPRSPRTLPTHFKLEEDTHPSQLSKAVADASPSSSRFPPLSVPPTRLQQAAVGVVAPTSSSLSPSPGAARMRADQGLLLDRSGGAALGLKTAAGVGATPPKTIPAPGTLSMSPSPSVAVDASIVRKSPLFGQRPRPNVTDDFAHAFDDGKEAENTRKAGKEDEEGEEEEGGGGGGGSELMNDLGTASHMSRGSAGVGVGAAKTAKEAEQSRTHRHHQRAQVGISEDSIATRSIRTHRTVHDLPKIEAPKFQMRLVERPKRNDEQVQSGKEFSALQASTATIATAQPDRANFEMSDSSPASSIRVAPPSLFLANPAPVGQILQSKQASKPSRAAGDPVSDSERSSGGEGHKELGGRWRNKTRRSDRRSSPGNSSRASDAESDSDGSVDWAPVRNAVRRTSHNTDARHSQAMEISDYFDI